MDFSPNTAARLEDVTALARQVADVGAVMGLPCVAASADIGSPEPMVGADGRPLAETIFHWIDPSLKYWEDRGFALRSAFVYAARASSEPFCFVDGHLESWRPSPVLEAINARGRIEANGVGAAIIAPAYLPGGVIAAVVWASADAAVDARAAFDARAADLHALALKFMASYTDAIAVEEASAPARLTRREIQCLKWAAAGKTGAEIAQIVHIALPTVRFHLTNATRKLHVFGLSQAVHRATTLGYIGGEGAVGAGKATIAAAAMAHKHE